ncbi:tetratricopeptide repeat protein [Streptomyces sp. NBC_00988]|uniref:tetratricopeptide repeat protein n=1 Tax=Streptomyces sp. NBC_00988 TaxID=2903704 RepID=UPI0038640FBF|nr:tetratricopeptide repeat protein [Streptomyces sp. NBC_00988]
MAEQRISRQELIRRQRRTGFVGRQGQLASFKEVLRQLPEESVQFLFHIRGPAGVGKSTLLRQMESAAREAQAVSSYIDETVTDAVEVMEAISGQFAQQGLPMKAFEKRLGTYRQRLHEVDATAATSVAGESAEPTPSAAAVVASKVGLVGLGMLPGIGAFTGSVDAQQVAAGAIQLKAMLSTKFNSRDDVQLVLSPLQELTPVFLEDLSEISQRRQWVSLFIDTYERTGPILDPWLRAVLLSDKYGELPANVLVVLAGQPRLEERWWGDFADVITDLPLEVFTEAEARQLLATKGVTDERVIEVILQLSGRLPVLVSTLAESRPSSVEEVGDPSGTAVERFLKWETDPARRAVALACALPQELDEDIYRAVVADDAENLFSWLKSMPFVNYRSGQCRYHDVVRETMLRVQRQQSPLRWQEEHNNLADAFRRWRIELEGDVTLAGAWWDEEQWRTYQNQEMYHRLCANPRTGLLGALRVLIEAHKHDISSLRRCVRVVLQAGRDTDSARVSDLGQQMLRRLEDRATARIKCLSLLLSYDELASEDRVRIYILRALSKRRSQAADSAVSDYSAALALDPMAARAYSGRGLTYQQMEQYEDSLADFDRALEIDPDISSVISSRGLSHFFARNFDEALADFDRSIELDPEGLMAYVFRGLTYGTLQRFDDSAADFKRAIEIEPESPGAYLGRGLTYYSSKRYDDALSDFNRLADLTPDDVQVLCHRGRTFDAVGRFDDALTDYNRALDLDPRSVSGHISRGLTYQSLERYDDALADFSRALDLDPQSAWAYINRGLTLASLERHDNALVDFNRALEIESGNAMFHGNRAVTYRSLERYDEALADLNRAIELEPDMPGLLGNRAVTYRSLERYDEALADLNRAIELSPDVAGFYSNRGMTYRSLERYDEALADLDRAIELEPGNASFYGNRGLAYRSLRRYDEALADLNRASELDVNDVVLYTNRAELYTDMRRFEDALLDIDRCLELDPRNGRAYSVRGSTYEAMGRLTDALNDYDRSLEIEPTYTWGYCKRGDVYHDLALFDEALADFDRALEMEPADTYAMSRQCLIFRLMGRIDESFAKCSRILEVESESSQAYTDQGVVYRLKGEYDQALAAFDRAIEFDPQNAWAYYEKSVVLYATLHRDRKRFLMRTIRVITEEPGGIEKKGNLFLSSCLLPRWQRAEVHFADFMSSDPVPGILRQLLTAVDSMAVAVPSRVHNLTNFRERIKVRILQVSSEGAQSSQGHV